MPSPRDSHRHSPGTRVCLISLGCPKNQVDSENLLGGIVDAELVLCPDPADADVAIVNTCGFIQPARDECDQVLKDLLRLKHRRKNPLRRLAVVGCWVEREKPNLIKRYPEVDLWLGLLTPERLAALISWITGGPSTGTFGGPSFQTPAYEGDRPRIGFQHVAYLRICDGCLNNCAYCTIPSIRGPLRSKPMEDILREAEDFRLQGVSELILVGQDLGNYGRDRSGGSGLSELVAALDCRIDVPWIRLMYLHPAHVDSRLLDALAVSRRIVHYLDLPLQHISDRILHAMNRGVTRKEIDFLIDALRAMWPDLVLRTTFIVGFPGETDEDFAELENFVRTCRFERLGCFPYCPEEGTPAAAMTPKVPQDIIDRRHDRLMKLQQQITFDHNTRLVGCKMPVIIDGVAESAGEGQESGWEYLGRTYGDAPDIDGTILLSAASGDLVPGEIVTATVTAAHGYDLTGRVEPA